MPAPGEYKTVQARILAYAREIGWTFVPRDEAEQCRELRPRWTCAGRAAVITSRLGFTVPQILFTATQAIGFDYGASCKTPKHRSSAATFSRSF
jgi:hypothetical protein